jgi:acyl carrier protein
MTVASTEISTRVISVVSEILKIDKSKILPESKFKEDLGVDSLDKLSLLMALEDEFGESISDSEAEKFTTVSSVTEFIENRLKSDSKSNQPA